MLTREQCVELDAKDQFVRIRERFVLPEGVIYFDGNSLGPMPKSVPARVATALEQEWAQDLITSWNKHGWFKLPHVTGDKLARLIGAPSGSVIVADTISVNVFKALTSALALRPDRKVILSDTGNFPSDLYVAQGLNTFLNNSYELRLVDPEQIEASINDDVAVVMVTEIDYRTARRHNMKAVTERAHAKGALTLWDLAHSAGALAVNLTEAKADFAVGCTYKYLNGGPGAPAFIYVNPKLQDAATPALVGWWGHAEPFAFSTKFTAAAGIARQQCGTQAILSLQALNAVLDEWNSIEMHAVQEKSHRLCEAFINMVESKCKSFGLQLSGPRVMQDRGSHVSFHCPNGYAVMQALIAIGVIGDFRAPDVIRFGFSALYNTFTEVHDATELLHDVLSKQTWNKSQYLERKSVT